MKKSNTVTTKELLNEILNSIKEKKGKEIVSIDLNEIDNSVCKYFVICNGDSTTQVKAISDEVKQKTRENLDAPVDHVEGLQNSHWILMDYIDIVVHIFLPEQRSFYRLEELWADGVLSKHED